MKNNSFKKVALLCTTLAMNMISFAVSTGGAVAAGVGAATGAVLVAHGINKSHKRNKEEKVVPAHSYHRTKAESQVTNTRKTKRDLKRDLKHEIRDHNLAIKKHRLALKKLEKKGKGSKPEAAQHRTMITRLESLVEELKRELERI